MAKTKIRCAVIGLGRIAATLEEDPLREKPATHAGAITAHQATQLLAGADPNSQKRQQFQNRWHVKYTYDKAQTLLKHHPIDILHIATPPQTHLKLMQLAIRHNVPVIVVEKPLTQTTQLPAAYAFLNRYPHALQRIIVNHERRFARDYAYVKTLVTKKVYGDLLSMRAELYAQGPSSTYQLLEHDGTHLLDAIFYLLEDNPRTTFNTQLQALKRTNAVNLPLTPYSALRSSHITHPPPQVKDYPLHASLTTHRSKENAMRTETLHVTFQYSQGAYQRIPVAITLGSARRYFHFAITLIFRYGRIDIGNGILSCKCSAPSPYYQGFHSLKPDNAHRRVMKKTYPFANMMQEAVDLFNGEKIVSTSSILSGILPLSLGHAVRASLLR